MRVHRRLRFICILVLFSALTFVNLGLIPRDQHSLSPVEENLHRGIIILTSFWAPRFHDHEAEVKAAIAANLVNEDVFRVHILFEANQDFGCVQFKSDLRDSTTELTSTVMTKLACTNWYHGQPTYFDMFHFAREQLHGTDIVILANGDMVFDHTVATLKTLTPSSMVVIATSGLDRLRTPPVLLQFYERAVVRPIQEVVSRCYLDGSPRTSWDAYAFHPAALSVSQDDFKDMRTGELFTMNRNGAENAALEAVSRNSSIRQYSQICDHVKMWHFHTSPKMHKSEIGVKHNQLRPDSCYDSVEDCLIPGHLSWTIRDVSELT